MKILIIGEQSHKHTDLLSCILEMQGEQKADIESLLEQQEETQEDVTLEEKQTLTLEDIDNCSWIKNSYVYLYGYHGCYFSVGITWKHKDPPTRDTPPPTHILPAKEPKRPACLGRNRTRFR